MLPRRRLRQSLLFAARGAVATLALLGYLAASIGFPAYAPRTAPSDSPAEAKRPAACRGRACGCTGADHCCCSTPTPKAPAAEADACPHCAAETASSDCCSSKAAPPREALRRPTSSVVWVTGLQARHCRGLDNLWFSLSAVLPLPAPLTWVADGKPNGWLPSLSADANAATEAPPSPPPRA